MMDRPAWGAAPIRCGKMKCKWRGLETDLVSITHRKIYNATQSVCPTCGCDSYMFMTEKEIAAWKRKTEVARGAETPKEGAGL